MSALNYAPIDSFSGEISGGVVTGLAAPAGGRLPCLLGLFADEIPIAFARATRFSEEAEADELRLGWCGFELPGLRQGVALGGSLTVRCGVSGRVVLKPRMDKDIFGTVLQKQRVVTVWEALRLSRVGEGCPDTVRLAVFGRDHLRLHGVHAFLTASYRTVLGRQIDQTGLAMWDGVSNAEDHVEELLNDLVDSAEYRSQVVQTLPGPFQSAFEYDHTLIV